MSRIRARSRALGRGLVGASLIAGLTLAALVAPLTPSDEAGAGGAFGPAPAHADPVPTPSVRPTPTASPSPTPTAPADSGDGKCSENSPSYIKNQPEIFDAVGVRRAWEISRG